MAATDPVRRREYRGCRAGDRFNDKSCIASISLGLLTFAPSVTQELFMTPSPRVLRAVPALRRSVAQFRDAGETIALVPTMGALHEGHLRLVQLAHKRAQRVIVSIFVNPTQFAPHEDLASYPRSMERDLSLLTGIDLIWA